MFDRAADVAAQVVHVHRDAGLGRDGQCGTAVVGDQVRQIAHHRRNIVIDQANAGYVGFEGVDQQTARAWNVAQVIDRQVDGRGRTRLHHVARQVLCAGTGHVAGHPQAGHRIALADHVGAAQDVGGGACFEGDDIAGVEGDVDGSARHHHFGQGGRDDQGVAGAIAAVGRGRAEQQDRGACGVHLNLTHIGDVERRQGKLVHGVACGVFDAAVEGIRIGHHVEQLSGLACGHGVVPRQQCARAVGAQDHLCTGVQQHHHLGALLHRLVQGSRQGHHFASLEQARGGGGPK